MNHLHKAPTTPADAGFLTSDDFFVGATPTRDFSSPDSIRLRVVGTSLADLVEMAVEDWRWRFQDRRNNPWRDA
jgi:hypothetical protein